MRIKWGPGLNFFALFVLFWIVSGIETTLWKQLFGVLPSPLLWLSMMVYIAIYRKPFTAILMIYFFAVALTAFSLAPLKMMLFPLAVLFFLLTLFKDRVFWTGPSYFLIVTTASVFIYNLLYMGFSQWLEPNPSPHDIGQRLLTVIITPIFSYPLYSVLSTMDKWTHQDFSQEAGGVDL